MPVLDAQGNPLSGCGRNAAARLDAALLTLAAFRLDPLADAEALIAHHPDFVMGHVLRATLFLMAAEPFAEAELKRSIADAYAHSAGATERERLHLQALSAWARRDFLRSAEVYTNLTTRFPTDLLALQVGQQADFFTGRTTELRDRINRAMVFWSYDMPGRSFLDGMLAFGLEENNQFGAALESGLRALARCPGDAWAIHAVAHVAEMKGRTEDGIAFLTGRANDWAPDNMLAYHNWWHLALFHLDNGAIDEVLRIHDNHLARAAGAPALELVDAAAMLWRLHLRGIDVRERFAPIADAWEATLSGAPGTSYQVFNDVHAALAFAGAGRLDRASDHLAAIETLTTGDSSHSGVAAEVGLPVVKAIYAFAAGDPAAAAELLLSARPGASRMGGSNAQRDLISLTLLAAAEAAGDATLAGALAAERHAAKPESPFALAALRRTLAMNGRMAA